MAEEKKGGIPPLIEAFRWDLNAACAFEEATGKSAERIDVHSNRELRTLLWSGIRYQKGPDGRKWQESASEMEVGELVTSDNVVAVAALVKGRMVSAELPGDDAKNP